MRKNFCIGVLAVLGLFAGCHTVPLSTQTSVATAAADFTATTVIVEAPASKAAEFKTLASVIGSELQGLSSGVIDPGTVQNVINSKIPSIYQADAAVLVSFVNGLYTSFYTQNSGNHPLLVAYLNAIGTGFVNASNGN